MKDILGVGRTDWKMWLLYLAVAVGYLGASTSFITLATNDARDYQPVYIQTLALCGVALMLALTFAMKYEGKRRSLALIPICMSLIGIASVLTRWRVVFG